MRRLATIVIIAGVTATATLWWLHDGDLGEAVRPVLQQWDAELLLRDAGVEEPSSP